MHPILFFVLTIVSLTYALPFRHARSGLGLDAIPLHHRRIAMRSSTDSPSPPPSVNTTSDNIVVDLSHTKSLAAAPSDQKYVMAHHMVGNTYPYTAADWDNDVKLAHASGIDGFALNIGADSWMPQKVADAYAAAQRSGTGFKMFVNFDMTTFPCNSANDAQLLRNYVTTYATHPNQFRYGGRVFVGTFAGQDCKFGQGSVPQGWASQFTRHPQLTGQNAVFFVPSFFIDPHTFNQYGDVMDGALNWNSAWAIQVTTAFANSMFQALGTSTGKLARAAITKFIGSTTPDDEYLSGLAGMPPSANKRVYMGTVSPWFFTHYSPQTYNKNYVYLTDEHLYARRWEHVIAKRDEFDLMEILTWNDYGESHYIGPINGAQPNSQAWVDGFAHTGWLALTKYYATAYKTGSYPPVTEDNLVLWARPHPGHADAPDSIGRPANFELSSDKLWAVVMATEPSSVTLNGQTFSVAAGVTKLSVKLAAGDKMHGTISRSGQDVATVAPAAFTFNPNPPSYNYNAFVASSS